MHTYLSEGFNAIWPLHQAILREHLLLYNHIIYLCKISVMLVVLCYKTWPTNFLQINYVMIQQMLPEDGLIQIPKCVAAF